MRNIIMGLFISVLFAPRFLVAAHYDLDSDHTTIGFTVRHLMISKVKGKFDKFSGAFDYDPKKPDAFKAEATIQAASINTAVKERDTHLRSADFLNAAKFPTITFTSKGVKESTANSVKLDGLLTIRGVTKPVVLNVELGGNITDPWGNKKAAFSATTKINRKDFGLTWNKTLETGGVLVGDDIEIGLEVEGQEKAAQK